MLNIVAGLAILQAASTQAAEAPAAPPVPPKPACASEAHAAFDFWVGEWNVRAQGSDKQGAESKVERVSEGCVIRETWMPFRGFDGSSMTFINHRSGRWQQVWVGGNGVRIDFEGGIVDGKMVLTGYWDDLVGPDQDALVRMTYSRMEDGSVRQFGEASTDHGVSWQTSFDLIYTRKDTE